METVKITFPAAIYAEIRAHLLQPEGTEDAAFVFCNYEANGASAEFALVDWLAVETFDCVARSAHYLELKDELRARVIKRAHDLGASLVEIHSHRSRLPAMFSASDFSGFADFVPHVWWRLKGRPYAAVVVAEDSVDGLAWLHGPDDPQPITAIVAGAGLLQSTGHSLRG